MVGRPDDENPALTEERFEELADPLGDGRAGGGTGAARPGELDAEGLGARGEHPAHRALPTFLTDHVDEARLRETVDMVVHGLLVHPQPLRQGSGVVWPPGELGKDPPRFRVVQGAQPLRAVGNEDAPGRRVRLHRVDDHLRAHRPADGRTIIRIFVMVEELL